MLRPLYSPGAPSQALSYISLVNQGFCTRYKQYVRVDFYITTTYYFGMTNDASEKILAELQALRREVSFLVPTESLADYENAEEISDAYDEARTEFNLD